MTAHITFDKTSDKVAQRVTKMRSSVVRDLFSAAVRPDIISLSGGMPDVSLLPHAAIRKATRAAVDDQRAIALQYGSTDGRRETKQVFCDLMRDIGVRCKPEQMMLTSGAQQALDLIGKTFLDPDDGRRETKQVFCDLMRDIGVRCKPEQMMLTSGAQQALDLIGKTFLDPDDIVIVEGPTYLTALQAFSAYEPQIVAVPFDDQGMRMDLLEAELERIGKGNPRLKFCYTIPNFQNPGGVTMTPERRKRLIELSHEYDFLVVEDDPYGRLRYEGGHQIPLKANPGGVTMTPERRKRLIELSHEYDFLVVEDDPYGRLRYEGGHQIPLKALDDQVIYLGTISKVFAPGLRTGWIAAPTSVISKINLVKQGTDLCGSSFDQVVVEHYFTDTPWQRTLQKFVKTYGVRRDAMLAALEEYFPPEASWTHPEGGFFVWVTLPEYVDTGSMLAEALDAGVTYVPGDSFYPDGDQGKNCMRIGFFVWVTLPEYVDTGSMLAEALDAGVTYVPGDSFYPDGDQGKNCMRINFSYETPENITEAIRRLANVIEDRLELCRVFIEAGALGVRSR